MDSQKMGLMYMDYIIWAITLSFTLYYYGRRKYDHFKKKGIKYVEPTVPFFGNPIFAALGMENFFDFVQDLYNAHPDQKYIGIFELQKPVIFVRDVEILKLVMIKDFDHFVDHSDIINEDLDPLFGKCLISLKGDRWRRMRASLTPAFTNSKIKKMFELVRECSLDFTEFYVDKAKETGDNVIEVDVKDGFTKFSADVIATSAYGFKINSLKNPNNKYYKNSKRATDVTGVQLLKILFFKIIPSIFKTFNITIIGSEASKFFRELVLNAIKNREETGDVRHDMIHLLAKAKNNTLKQETPENELRSNPNNDDQVKHWSDDDLVAQALLFSMAGFETTATAITFFFYEMVRNPEIQNKLQLEIDDLIAKCDGNVEFDDLQSLKYLEMCVLESLRLWPPATSLERVCTKDYVLPPPCDSSTKTYQIKAGQSVWLPAVGLQRDPKHFPNPDQYNPERFSEENKSSFDSLAFLTFGNGPRSCIGSRFGLISTKTIIFHMLAKFTFFPINKTKIPVELDNKSFSPIPKDGMHLGLRLRNC